MVAWQVLNFKNYYVHDKFLTLFSTPALAGKKKKSQRVIFFPLFDDIGPLSLLLRILLLV